MKLRHFLPMLAVVSLPAALSHAQGCNPQAFPQPLRPPGIALDTDFGASVAVLGNYALVGSPKGGSGGGKVHLYELIDGDWQLTNEFADPGGIVTDRFGAAVALDGTRAYVGAPGANGKVTADGAVYVYNRTTILGNEMWLLEAKLFGSGGQVNDRFGEVVAVDSGVVMIGVPGHDIADGTDSGRADVFERISGQWNKVATLGPSSPVQFEQFGSSIAKDGSYAVIGSPTFNGTGPDPIWNGRAHVYQRQSSSVWTLDAVLNPSDAVLFRQFGASVAIQGTRILVGSPGAEDESLGHRGAGYIYEKPFGSANWVFSAKLASAQYDYDGEFGRGVVLTLNQAWVAGVRRIRRFDFAGGNWSVASDPVEPFLDLYSSNPTNTLGPILAADGVTVFVGAPGQSYLEDEYVFPFHACGGSWTVVGSGTSGIQGKPRLRGAGSLQDGLALEFRLVDGKPSAPALFMVHAGAAPAGAKFAGGLLYTLPIHFSVVVPLDAEGEVSLPTVLLPGFASAKFTSQVLISDPFTVSDLVLSNALEFQIGL